MSTDKRSKKASRDVDSHGCFRSRTEEIMAKRNIRSWYALGKLAEIPATTLYKYRDEFSSPNVHHAISIASALQTTVENLWCKHIAPGQKAAQTRMARELAMTTAQRAALTRKRRNAARKAVETRRTNS